MNLNKLLLLILWVMVVLNVRIKKCHKQNKKHQNNLLKKHYKFTVINIHMMMLFMWVVLIKYKYIVSDVNRDLSRLQQII